MTWHRATPNAARPRHRLGSLAVIATVGLGAAFTGSSQGSAADRAFTGPGVIIPDEDQNPADPYPSTITVNDAPGSIVSVRVTLTELVHTYAEDLNIAVQAPNGKSAVLMADCRGGDHVDGTLTFSDDGVLLDLEAADELVGTGTYAPSRCDAPEFEDDPEAGINSPCPCWASLAALAGGPANGDWKLWVYDDEAEDGGSLAGWTLELTTNAAPVARDRSFTVTRDGALRGTLAGAASDAENDDLAFGVAARPAHGRVVVDDGGAFRYVPAARFVGVDRFRYRVDDGRSTDEGTVTITITAPNRTCAGKRATIVGTAGNDVLTGTPGPDVIFSGGGRDWVRGGDGNDTICTGAGNDTVRAGWGNDLVVGRGGQDILVGGPGNDTLRAGSGRDALVGLGGTDHCSGGSGVDRAAMCEITTSVP